jgi:hypothetical protein
LSNLGQTPLAVSAQHKPDRQVAHVRTFRLFARSGPLLRVSDRKNGYQAEFLRRWPPWRFASLKFIEAAPWFSEPDAPKRIGLASPALFLATTGD